MNTLKLIVLSTVLLIVSCEKKPELSSGIIKNNMDTLVKPGDNFESYVNGTWMKNTQIPADKNSYGVSYMLYDQSQKDVKAIIEEASRGNFANGSDQQKIGDFYASYINRKQRDSIGLAPLQPELQKIDAIKSYSELAKYFGRANEIGLNIPLQFFVMADLKNPKQYALYASQSGLGLPEREYYLQNDAEMMGIRQKYIAHITTMFQLANIPNASENAIKIMALETALAKDQMKKEDARDIKNMYNKYETKELKTLMADFDWTAMLENAGVSNQKNIIITQVDYTKKLNNIIKNTPLETWKIYLKWGLIDNSATLLTTELDQQNFAFYSKTLYGTEKQAEDWKRAVNTVNNNLGEIVGKVYVEKHFSPEAKERITVLVKNLLNAYAESIKNLDWMSEATKKEALAKIDKFTIKVGYPDKWIDYASLKVAKNDLYGNIQNATAFEYKKMLDKLGKPLDRTEWEMTPQTVNAYYNPPLNEIVFPAAILQPPFFDLNADDAVNYGGIGAVIGHEIGHGFDDQGSTFDGDGVLRNWWTADDLSAFKNKTKMLVEQFDSYKPFPDLNLNGGFTLGENIGDLGGLTIAIKAYKITLNGKEAPVLDGFTGMQRVFIAYAQTFQEIIREKSLRNQVATDPHSPAKYRVNGIVRNIPEFYEAFSVKPTDSLFLAPEKRVKIW